MKYNYFWSTKKAKKSLPEKVLKSIPVKKQ